MRRMRRLKGADVWAQHKAQIQVVLAGGVLALLVIVASKVTSASGEAIPLDPVEQPPSDGTQGLTSMLAERRTLLKPQEGPSQAGPGSMRVVQGTQPAELPNEMARLTPEARARLEERLKTLSAQLGRMYHEITVREIDANRAYYSSAVAGDPALAKPEESEDEFFTYASRETEYFLVRFTRSQSPELFELRDEERALRDRLAKFEVLGTRRDVTQFSR